MKIISTTACDAVQIFQLGLLCVTLGCCEEILGDGNSRTPCFLRNAMRFLNGVAVLDVFLTSLIASDEVAKEIHSPTASTISTLSHPPGTEFKAGIRERLTTHLNRLKDVLLDSSRPTTSKRYKSDLYIWREIFTFYESSAILCPTRECTCLVEKLDDVELRYVSFFSTLEAKHYVCVPTWVS